MATRRSTKRLERYEEHYRELTRQLADIGYVISGSLAQRLTRCGRATCACSAEPPKLHGPYWHWSTKVNGKTVNRRLSEREAALYNEWLDNHRRAKALFAQMHELAAKATELILEQQAG